MLIVALEFEVDCGYPYPIIHLILIKEKKHSACLCFLYNSLKNLLGQIFGLKDQLCGTNSACEHVLQETETRI